MQKRAGYESDRFRLVVYDRKSGEIRNLTENFDRWVGTMSWAPDSKSIYFTAEDKGEIPIYRINVDPAGAPQEVTRGSNDDLVVTPDGKTLVFTRMSMQSPNEVYKLTLGGKEAEAQAVSVRSRARGDEGVMPFAAFLEKLKVEIATRALPEKKKPAS